MSRPSGTSLGLRLAARPPRGPAVSVRRGAGAARPSRSCGCIVRVSSGLTTKYPAEFHAWRNMIRRCTKRDCREFFWYGARGITVCDQWIGSFELFLSDVGPRPTKKHTLEREDNDQGYCPANCRWATRREQSSNTRRNHLVTYLGKTQTVTEWAHELGITPETLFRRLRVGWGQEKAMATPVDARFRNTSKIKPQST